MNATKALNDTADAVNFFDVHSPGKVIYGVALAVVSVTATSFTLAVLRRSKNRGEEDNAAMLFQLNSICNAITGLSMAGLAISYDQDGTLEYSPYVCQVFKTIMFISNFQTNASVTAITVNRYLMIRWPLQYNSLVGVTQMRIVVATILAFSALYLMYLPVPGFPFYRGLTANCFSPDYPLHSQVVISTFMTVFWFSNQPVVVLVNALLVKSALRARQSRRIALAKLPQPRQPQPQQPGASPGDPGNTTLKSRGIVLVIYISVIYLVFSIPSTALLTLLSLQIVPFPLMVYLGIFTIWICISIWNLVAFMMFDTKFRRIVCSMCCIGSKDTARGNQLIRV